MLLGRWETCIDLAAEFLAFSTLGSRGSTVALASLRRHIHTRAAAAVRRVRDR